MALERSLAAAPPRGEASRPRRTSVQPSLITAALARPPDTSYLHSATPASATSSSAFASYVPSPSSSSSPSASFVGSPMAHRSSSRIAAYNPQQWGPSGPVGGTFVPHASPPASTSSTSRTREVTGMEGKSILALRFLLAAPGTHPLAFQVQILRNTEAVRVFIAHQLC